MNILDRKQKYLLLCSGSQTMIATLPQMKLLGQKLKQGFTTGSMQYETGIAALCKGSLVMIYDFRYGKRLKQIDTYLGIVSICFLKNLIIAVSEERILIHDLIQNQNLCYIETQNGKSVGLYPNYFDLKIIYPVNTSLFKQLEIFTAKTTDLQLIEIKSSPIYDHSGTVIALKEDCLLSLYQNGQIVKGCSFNSSIDQVIPSKTPKKFYVQTVGGGGKNNEPLFISLSPVQKKYLKIKQQGEKILETEINGGTKGRMFEMGSNLYIWRGKRVYETMQDDDPIFFQYRIQKAEEVPVKQEVVDKQNNMEIKQE